MELTDKNELHNTLLFMESMENLSYGKKIYGKVIQQVVNMPTIEAEPVKHGHWIWRGGNLYECSECGQNVMTNDIECYKYCHGCGARMGEEEE